MTTFVQPPAYPLRLRGVLDERQARWSWLYKWFLAIPHLIVLGLLWIAVVVAWMIAGLSVLFTTRYPRPLFDFVVGVLRWSWRVSFYAFAPIGTDIYPPFSLERDDSYPADLDVDYPPTLSRGLVLVKWWLLIIPQAIVVALLSGGWGPAHFSLISVLALAGVITRLINGRYPGDLFRLTVGLQRWCYRVMAYGLLLTDVYPPFRLDQGEWDPTPASYAVPVP